MASPSLWGRLLFKHRRGLARGCAKYTEEADNVYLQVEVRDDKAGRGFQYKPIEVSVIPGVEDLVLDADIEAPEYEDNGTLFDAQVGRD